MIAECGSGMDRKYDLGTDYSMPCNPCLKNHCSGYDSNQQ